MVNSFSSKIECVTVSAEEEKSHMRFMENGTHTILRGCSSAGLPSEIRPICRLVLSLHVEIQSCLLPK